MSTIKRFEDLECWQQAREFVKFLDYSRSSIAETISHCYVALDQGYILDTEMKNANERADIVWKKVNNLISYLNNFQNGTKKLLKTMHVEPIKQIKQT